MKFFCCMSKTDLTEPLPPPTGSIRKKPDPSFHQYNVPEDVKYVEPPYHKTNNDSSTKPQGELLAAPGPERSRDRTQMSSPLEAQSDDDLRVSGKALSYNRGAGGASQNHTQTHTHCSSVEDHRESRSERPEREESSQTRHRERSEKEERRRESSSTAANVTSSGDEWRRWKDNPACEDYVILNTLGRGAFADVVLGRHKQTNKHHALKVVYLNKPGLKEKHVAVLQREGTYLRKLQHKNIVRCLKVYQSTNQWVFVLEYLKGGMLLNDLAKLKRYSEKTAAAVFRQVLSAVAYLHENNVVHRDIKPENVVFKTSVSNSAAFGKDNIVKLVDFGMILDLSKEPHSRGMMGSPGFVAPEVILGQHHTSQMDCYSLGVLLFVMLVGAKPMTQDQARSMQYALMTPESLRGMHDPRWRVLSEPAKDLILKLLQPDPKNRYTAKQALNHRWIKGAREDSILDGSVMEGWADHLQLLNPGYMGSPSPLQAVGGGFSPHYNMPQNRIMSPHNSGGYRTTSFRQSSKHRPSSAAPSGTPVSPLGVPITSQFTPTPASGPTDLARTPSRAQGGTPPADVSALSNPFSWNAEGGHSAPLPPFPDAAHKAVHDEVMKRAQEKLAQAQQFYMTAQIMRQADSSGGLLHAPLSVGLLQAPGQAPASPSGKPLSGQLHTDGSEVTQWTSRTQENSLSAVAQSYMSTQNTSGATAGLKVQEASTGASSSNVPRGAAKASADFDATLKDARNLMNELNKAPSLPHGTTSPQPTDTTYPPEKISAHAHSSNGYRRSKSGLVGNSSHSSHQHGNQVPKSPHRSRKAATGGLGSHGHSRHSTTGSRGHGSSSSTRHSNSYTAVPAPNSQSGAGTPTSRRSSRRQSAPHTSDGTTRPPSILEMPIQDPARDAYYGGAIDPEEKLSPTAASRSSGMKKGSRRPATQRTSTSSRSFGAQQPRSKGSHSKRSGGAAGEMSVPDAE